MITPAYTLTATERVLPKLALDFTTASLDARVTLTRALNTATRINSSGYVETINANLPRFDFTLNTGGACKGLLIEESRGNIIQRWSDFTQTAVWSATSAGGGSVPTNTGNTTLSPDGVNNAQIWSFTAPVSGDRSVLSQTVPGLATGFWASSIFMKAGRAEDVGKIISIKETQGGTYTLVTLTNQWQRPESINTSAATTHGMAIELRPLIGTSTGTVQAAIWGAQTEAGAFITSAIPNTGTGTVTRNADAVSMTGTNFSDWYNATEGTFSIDCIINTRSAAQILMEMSDGTSANRIQYQRDTGSNVLSYVAIVSSSITVNLQKASAFVNDTASITAAYKLDNYGVAVNGGATTTDTSSGVPTVDRMRIGATVAGTALSNGWYQKIFYYPQRLTNSEIQAFSK